VLVGRGHAKGGKYQHKHEDIVDAERLLDQVTGQELQPDLGTLPNIHCRVERQCQADPNGAPNARLTPRDNVRLAVDDAQIERQHGQHEQIETDPQRRRPDAHGSSPPLPVQ
jgi:hypothetical protein